MISMGSRVKSAFTEQGNYIGLAAALGLSIAFLNPLPLVMGIIGEIAYLLFVPDSKWYSDILAKRDKEGAFARRQRLKEKVFEVVGYDFREEYNQLESVRTQLDDDYAARPDWRSVIDRLDTLLSKYLEFGLLDYQLRNYIQSLSTQAEEELPDLIQVDSKEADDLRKRLANTQKDASKYSDGTVRWVEQQMGAIRLFFQGQIDSIQQLVNEEEVRIASGGGNANNRDTLLKRIDIQRMSLNQAEKIGQGLVSLNQQMSLMEETIRLINGQIRSKQPGQVLADIEGLVDQSENVSNFLQEITPFEDTTEQQLMLSR